MEADASAVAAQLSTRRQQHCASSWGCGAARSCARRLTSIVSQQRSLSGRAGDAGVAGFGAASAQVANPSKVQPFSTACSGWLRGCRGAGHGHAAGNDLAVAQSARRCYERIVDGRRLCMKHSHWLRTGKVETESRARARAPCPVRPCPPEAELILILILRRRGEAGDREGERLEGAI